MVRESVKITSGRDRGLAIAAIAMPAISALVELGLPVMQLSWSGKALSAAVAEEPMMPSGVTLPSVAARTASRRSYCAWGPYSLCS